MSGFCTTLRAGLGGNIINLASIYGELGPDWSIYEGTNIANPAAYSASKGGIIQLTKWLATSYAPYIRANAISPGGIFRDQPKSFVNKYSKRVPLGRMATEEDLKGVIAFLASDAASYVTGQTIRVDGGLSVILRVCQLKISFLNHVAMSIKQIDCRKYCVCMQCPRYTSHVVYMVPEDDSAAEKQTTYNKSCW